MTGDLGPAMTWLRTIADAVAAGQDWRAASDRHIRTLPTCDQVAPRLYAVVLARWISNGQPPADAIRQMHEVLTAASLAWRAP